MCVRLDVGFVFFGRHLDVREEEPLVVVVESIVVNAESSIIMGCGFPVVGR